MGILGLSPFIQKTCPQAIKVFPERLKAFAGKTIAVDGTLLTQRFHFAPMPHKYRHVLGWYRCIMELREANVRPVVVFDGDKRHAAKRREVERRRQLRRVEVVRGAMEADRFHRLQELQHLVNAEMLNASTRAQLASSVQNIFNEESPPTELYSYDTNWAPFGELTAFEVQQIWDQSSSSLAWLPDATAIESRLDTLSHPPHSGTVVATETDDTTHALDHSSSDSAAAPQYSDATQLPYSSVSARSGEAKMITLYKQYRAAVPVFASMPPLRKEVPVISEPGSRAQSSLPRGEMAAESSPPMADTGDSLDSALTIDTPRPSADQPPLQPTEEVDTAMSRSQYQLVIAEGAFWQAVLDPARPIPDISDLIEKSTAIYESYQRRTNPPTAETYEECRAMIRALGIPCVLSRGAFEAEALAASIVAHGFADYVATEDSDVLLYDVPMIRHLATKKDPLHLISASEIRQELDLSASSFLDFAILLGTDFSQRIKNVGPARALKFIREHNNIENIVAHEGTRYPPRLPMEKYLEEVKLARSVFQTLPQPPPPALLEQGESDAHVVAQLIRDYGLYNLIHQEFDDGTTHVHYLEDEPAAFPF